MEKIILSGVIGDDITPQTVRKELDAAAGSDIEIHLASPGGYVDAGLEIYNAFLDYRRNHPAAQMILTVKGEAASMASYLAMNPAFHPVRAEANATLMIHPPQAGVRGDARDMKKMADVLEGLAGILAAAYSARTGKPIAEIHHLMNDETWYFGAEIRDHGFVHEMLPANPDFPTNRGEALARARTDFHGMTAKVKGAPADIARIAAMVQGSPPARDEMFYQANQDRAMLGLPPLKPNAADMGDPLAEQIRRDRIALGLDDTEPEKARQNSPVKDNVAAQIEKDRAALGLS
ncbi:MAG: Clp protease ClpP [Spirochaetes bacterium]|nr:Clp protease ClpP [Spirochaetota bacterium]